MKRINNYENIIPDFHGTSSPFSARSRWKAKWITAPNISDGAVIRYTLSVNLDAETTVHLSASDRYILYCDGVLAGRGPACGSHSVWYYDSYRISAGHHEICAIVYSQGSYRAWSHISFGNRFILTSDSQNELLATGYAAWQVQPDKRWSFFNSNSPQDGKRVGTSGRFIFDASAQCTLKCDAVPLEDGYTYSDYDIQPHTTPNLLPNRLPPMCEEEHDLRFSANIGANTSQIYTIALDNYYTAYPVLKLSGGKGAKIELDFSEALYLPGSIEKGNRSEVSGKEFRGIGDIYYPDGSCCELSPLWWLAGRYIQIRVTTKDAPLSIHSLKIYQSNYPLKIERLPKKHSLTNTLTPIMLRTLLMCMHETYMDCPHYEQLMYLGDTRIQMLICYSISDDTRLTEQSIQLLASAAHISGNSLPCCYPCGNPRVIPGFSLYFVAILYDYVIHTGNIDFIKPYAGIARSIIDAYLPERCGDAAETPSGWNFYDWTEGWISGVPDNYNGICYEFNAHLIYTLMLWSEIEKRLDEPEYAARLIRYAKGIKSAISQRKHAESEHYLCFMLLSGILSCEEEKVFLEKLLNSGGETLSVYFSHYLFEVFRKFGMYTEMHKYFERWRFLVTDGYFTVPEEFVPAARSDCHAWGAHPIYHYLMAEAEKLIEGEN